MNALLDTNILVDFKKGGRKAISVLDSLYQQNVPVMTSVICGMELLRGDITKEEINQTRQLLIYIPVVHISESISHYANELFMRFYKSRGLTIADSFIAATAYIHNMSLITLNKKHFSVIPGLTVERPY